MKTETVLQIGSETFTVSDMPLVFDETNHIDWAKTMADFRVNFEGDLDNEANHPVPMSVETYFYNLTHLLALAEEQATSCRNHVATEATFLGRSCVKRDPRVVREEYVQALEIALATENAIKQITDEIGKHVAEYNCLFRVVADSRMA